MCYSQVSEVVTTAIRRRVMPGACYACRIGDDYFSGAAGQFTYETGSASIGSDTVWDLASLTKVVATTTAAMLLFDRGLMPLSMPVADVLPAFGKQAVTVQNLLLHNSGLAASHPSSTAFTDPDELMANILRQPLVYETGAETIYSDLGFIVLGEVIEAITGQRLEVFVKSEVWDPLGMCWTAFRPPARYRGLCAPTEAPEPWRQELRRLRALEDGGPWIQGEVHDPTAMVLGGVAGHAGLFSTSGDLTTFMSMIMNKGEGLVRESTIELFTTRTAGTRALGWDTPSPGSSAGTRLGPRSFGHTGFTGTSIWADPDRDLFAILLTNRVHPTADRLGIKELRIAFHDSLAQL